MKRLAVLLSSLLLVGCSTPRQEPCPRCTLVDSRVKAAEAFMPGYWTEYLTRDLEPTGDLHSPEYLEHKKWIEVRDALDRAMGKNDE